MCWEQGYPANCVLEDHGKRGSLADHGDIPASITEEVDRIWLHCDARLERRRLATVPVAVVLQAR
jgi:hypothetical protein